MAIKFYAEIVGGDLCPAPSKLNQIFRKLKLKITLLLIPLVLFGADVYGQCAGQLTQVNVSCNGGSDGSIDLRVLFGTAPYTYSWSGPFGFTASSEDVSGLLPGAYNITVTDNNGCSFGLNATITEPQPISLNPVVSNFVCNQPGSVCVDANPTGGTAPYSVSGFGLNERSKDVVVSYDDGNILTTLPTLTDHQVKIAVTWDADMRADFGDVRFEYQGNVLPYWIEKYTASSSAVIWVKVPTLPEPGITLSMTYGNPLQTSASDGESVFEFFDDFEAGLDETKWFQGQQTTSGAGADMFVSGGVLRGNNNNRWIQSIADFSGSMILETRVLETNSNPNGFISAGFANISNQNAGILSHNGTSYRWYNHGNYSGIGLDVRNYWTRDIVSMANGTNASYVKRTREIGGEVFHQFTQSSLSGHRIKFGMRTDCCQNQDYDMAWDWIIVRKHTTLEPSITFGTEQVEASNNTVVCDVPEGNFTVTIEDINGCTASTSIMVDGPFYVSTSCGDSGSGSVDFTVAGGAGNLSYAWSGPNGFTATTEDISGLESGDYLVEVTDGSNCSSTYNVSVPGYDPITIDFAACLQNGSSPVDITVAGGVAPYTYSWSTGDVTEDLASVGPGTYTVTVTDANGCSNTASTTLSDLQLNINKIADACFNQCTGIVDLSATGGQAPYFFGTNLEYRENFDGGYNDVDFTKDVRLDYEVQNGELNAQVGGNTWSNFIYTNQTFTRSAGKIFQFRVSPGANSTFMIGWHGNNNGSTETRYNGLIYSFYFANGDIHIYEDGASRGHKRNYSTNKTYDLQIELKASGARYLIKESTQSEYTLIYDSNHSSESNLRLGLTIHGAPNGMSTDSWTVGEIEVTSGLCQGTHQFVVSDANGCIDTASVDLGTLTLSATTVADFCTLDSGAIDLTVTDGTAPLVSNGQRIMRMLEIQKI